jgi:large subunit ribosomal protein L15
VGFEGGQMPLQRRLPKVGFTSRKARYQSEVRLHELAKIEAAVIDLSALKDAHIVGHEIQRAKVIVSGELNKAVTVKGLAVTAGARKAIEAAGGKVEE